MAEEVQVTCRFTTKLPDRLRITDTPFAVPSRLTRYGLSEVVNHLLGHEKPVPFDFVINGEILHTSLEKFMVQRSLSAEGILTVEYIPALGPPRPETEAKHEDWVSAISGHWSRALVSGSYDSRVRLWDASGAQVAELHGHTAGITDVDVAPPTSSDSPATVVSVSKDGSARVFRVSLPAASRGAAAASAGAPLSVHADAVLSGHTEGVESVAVTADGARCATGGWDSALLLWDLRDVQAEAASQPPEAGAAGGGKRRKGAAGAAAPRAAAISEPAMRLAGHTGCVSAVCWQGTENLFSASWDHTLRRWDPDTGVNTQTLNAGGSKAIFALSVRADASAKLVRNCTTHSGLAQHAFGGADKAVRVWDPRASSTVATLSLLSHTSWVTAVRWCPWNENLLLSASHDGTLKVWDARGKVPLHTVEVCTDKLLAAAWHGRDRLACGGADSKVHVFTQTDAASLVKV